MASYYEQLTDEQKFKLENMRASFRMEGMEPSPAEMEIAAQQLLGLITRDEANRALNELGH